MDADHHGRALVDDSQLREDRPLGVEIAVSLAESNARGGICRAGAGDDEVQSTEGAHEVQIHVFGEQLGAVERRGKPGVGGGNAPWRDEVKPHRHSNRLQEGTAGGDQGSLDLCQTVVRRDEDRSVASVTGKLLKAPWQELTAGEVRDELVTKSLPDHLADGPSLCLSPTPLAHRVLLSHGHSPQTRSGTCSRSESCGSAVASPRRCGRRRSRCKSLK